MAQITINDVTKVTLKDLYQMGRDCYESIWDKAQQYDRDVKIYLHHTAGRYHQFFDDYHILIDNDGSIYTSVDDLSITLPHTWKRNTGAIGMTMLGYYGASYNGSLGDYAPTDAQIESMVQSITVLANALDLTIDIKRVMSHGEAADNEDGYYGAYGASEEYGPSTTCERWDLDRLHEGDAHGSGPAYLRDRANYYRDLWKNDPKYGPYGVKW